MKRELLSTRKAAQVLSVSESTVRRWCDVGKLDTVRSPGGHRKVPISSLMRLAREIGQPLSEPSIHGQVSLPGDGNFEQAATLLGDYLCQGLESSSISLVLSAYTAGNSISQLGDELIAPAMQEVGNRWEKNKIGVAEERRACHLVMNALREIERMMPDPSQDRPLAVGATPGKDHSQVGTQLVQMVFRAAGWRANQLGAGIPFSQIAQHCRKAKPVVLWLSSIHMEDREQFVADFRSEIESLIDDGLTLIVGGRGFRPDVLKELSYNFHGSSLSALETFIAGLPVHRRRNTKQDAASHSLSKLGG